MKTTTRLVHTAMEATVLQNGTTAPRALYAAFRKFNEEHFGGKLGAPLIWIGACSPRALGDYCGRDVHGLESRIRISDAAIKKGLEFATWVLLHEMIHAWAHEIAKDGEPGYRGHGPLFAGKCNAVGKAYGFREVSPKGRNGMPDCARWPFNAMEAAATEKDDDSAREGEPRDAPTDAPPCLHCGKKPARVPHGVARFCGSKCATAWLVAQTSPLTWCADHGWTREGDDGRCAACAAPTSANRLRCA